jgi:REP element-mobilizing transposase RayT
MANTFSQIYIQTVFAVSDRQSLIKPQFKEGLFKYITGIVTNQGQKLISINGMADHIHILIGLKPSMALADLVRDIKADSLDPRKQEQVGPGKLFMARRIRSIFVWTFSTRHNHPLHSESGKTPQAQVIQERILNLTEEI